MIEKIRPRVRVAGILIEDDRILLIEHTKNNKKYCNSQRFSRYI